MYMNNLQFENKSNFLNKPRTLLKEVEPGSSIHHTAGTSTSSHTEVSIHFIFIFNNFIQLCFCCVEILSKRKMGDRKYSIFSTGGRCQWLMKRWSRFSTSQKLYPFQYPRVKGFSTRLSVYRLSGGSPVTSGRATRTFDAGAVRTWFFYDWQKW